jgi:hypothetical protein
MDNIVQFKDWILVGGQSGLIYFQKDNIGRVYKQTFEVMDWFRKWDKMEGRLFWGGEHVIYQVKENADMPGFLEFSLIAKF